MTVAVLALFAEGQNAHRQHLQLAGERNGPAWPQWPVSCASSAPPSRKAKTTWRSTRPTELQPATIDTYGDHRMAMCFSLAALGGVPITIDDPELRRQDLSRLLQPCSRRWPTDDERLARANEQRRGQKSGDDPQSGSAAEHRVFANPSADRRPARRFQPTPRTWHGYETTHLLGAGYLMGLRVTLGLAVGRRGRQRIGRAPPETPRWRASKCGRFPVDERRVSRRDPGEQASAHQQPGPATQESTFAMRT